FFFFFSSRRRHTRCYRDWSSDVCSSDLFLCRSHFSVSFPLVPQRLHAHRPLSMLAAVLMFSPLMICTGRERTQKAPLGPVPGWEIGRASCRERVSIGWGGRRSRETDDIS